MPQCNTTYEPKCKKVQNPCKICLQTVRPKEGLQCMGKCESWAHFECLNYTPGRISDIEKGLITVTCPCPDCKTRNPKEYLTQDYTCNNILCPANNPPSCEEPDCQANEVSKARDTQCPPGTLRVCGQSCKQHTTPTIKRPSFSEMCLSGEPALRVAHPIPKLTCPSEAELAAKGMLKATTEVMNQMCRTMGEFSKQMDSMMQKMKLINEIAMKQPPKCCPPKCADTPPPCGAKPPPCPPKPPPCPPKPPPCPAMSPKNSRCCAYGPLKPTTPPCPPKLPCPLSPSSANSSQGSIKSSNSSHNTSHEGSQRKGGALGGPQLKGGAPSHLPHPISPKQSHKCCSKACCGKGTTKTCDSDCPEIGGSCNSLKKKKHDKKNKKDGKKCKGCCGTDKKNCSKDCHYYY